MQTDQQTHETAQYDALLAALNETKASLGSILKSAPGLSMLISCLQTNSYDTPSICDEAAGQSIISGQDHHIRAR